LDKSYLLSYFFIASTYKSLSTSPAKEISSDKIASPFYKDFSSKVACIAANLL